MGVHCGPLLRRKLLRADQPALVCAPLAVDEVKLPAPA
jgi:hypothetical protein